jgi:two-component system, NarL family, nitrate/nitrite response regulator NarL
VRVVICDDHAVFAESLAVVLDRAGFDVVAAVCSLDEAIAQLRRTRVDVCVLDLFFSVPSSTGTDSGATRTSHSDIRSIARVPELRAAAPSTRLLLLTGRLTIEVVTEAKAAGVHGFADKGCRPQEIIAAIARVNKGESVARTRTLHPMKRPDRRSSPVRRSAAYLTSRERQVLGQLCAGADTTGVANALGISWTTARSHIQNVLTKMGAHSRLEAATAAVQHGVVSGETGEWLL